jgi:hypothetical protein
VTFKASSGTLSAPTVVTDDNGEATVLFSCGNTDSSNRTATITATAGSVSRQILIRITGTTLSLSTDYTTLEIDASSAYYDSAKDQATLTITAKDAGKNPIYNAPIKVSVDSSSTGAVTLSPLSGYTDADGKVQIQVTGESKGTVIVRVEGLGTTATQTYTVGISGEIFSITSPTEDPYNLQKGESLTITVRAPTQSQVIFATTCGAWDGGTSAVVTKSVVDKAASAVLSSDDACVATVQVYDAQNPSTSDSIKVNIYLPADEASKIYLQAGAYVVAPSTGDIENNVALEALVRDDSFQIVPNVPVSFSISDSTGGGEYVSPPLAYTLEGTGKAEASFTSGSMSSGAQGVTVKAAVVGKPEVSDSVDIVIGGTAGSVVIGQSTTVESINGDTSYKLPMTAQVVDSNGNPVPDANISLQIWPKYYQTGVWEATSTGPSNCVPNVTAEYPNEDDTFPGTSYYRNLILDPGEDRNGDGQLTPSSSAAGAIPAEVVADSTGVASFDLIYPKSSAVWIVAEITASTLVIGSETRSKAEFMLPYSRSDAQACLLPDSPYNTSVPTMEIELTATPDKVVPDGGTSTSSIRALVTQLDEPVPDETRVSFAIIEGTGGFDPSLLTTEISEVTKAGQAGVTYYSGTVPGEVTIRALLADGTSATVTLTLTKGVGDPYAIDIDAEPDQLSADGGTSQSVVRADVTDSDGWPVFDGTPITFSIVSGSGTLTGGVNEYSTTTTAGIASVVYYSGSTPGPVVIRALAENGVNASTTITLGEVIGSMTLTASPTSIAADGTSSSAITATIRDSSGNPVPKETDVTFTSSPDLGQDFEDQDGDRQITVETPNETGRVTVSLISGNTAGVAIVTASATIGSNTVTQSTEVTFTSDVSLTLTADTLVIDADGTDSATITATLIDNQTLLPVQGTTIAFTKSLGNLSSASGVTDANGEVGVTFTSTTVGTATVTAWCTGASDSIQIVAETPP